MNVQVKLSNRKLTVMMNKSDFGGQCYIFFSCDQRKVLVNILKRSRFIVNINI